LSTGVGAWRLGTSRGLMVASGAHLSIASSAGGPGDIGGRLRGLKSIRASGGQTKSGASRSGSEGLMVGEHVPDRFGELSGDVDLGDLGAALAAQPALVALVALAIGRVAQRVHRGFEHRPAQVLGSLLGQRAAAIAITGLVDPGAQAGVATQLLG
jgi:hypothetical protein